MKVLLDWGCGGVLATVTLVLATWFSVWLLRDPETDGERVAWLITGFAGLPMLVLAGATAAGCRGGVLAVHAQRLFVLLIGLAFGLLLILLLFWVPTLHGWDAEIAATLLPLAGAYVTLVLSAAFFLAGARLETLWSWVR